MEHVENVASLTLAPRAASIKIPLSGGVGESGSFGDAVVLGSGVTIVYVWGGNQETLQLWQPVIWIHRSENSGKSNYPYSLVYSRHISLRQSLWHGVHSLYLI